MAVLLADRVDSFAQLLTVLLVFAFVAMITALSTKFIAGYQKKQTFGGNIEVIESNQIAANKFVQIVRVGDIYKVVAISKDNVTFLGDINRDDLVLAERQDNTLSFKGLLEKYTKSVKKAESDEGIKESEHDSF